MKNGTKIWLPVAAALVSLATSCVEQTDKLDLNKDISLDMQLAPQGITIPLGNVDSVFLDSILKVDENDPDAVFRKLDGGIYGISLNGEIDKVQVDIDDITVNIDNPAIDPVVTEFGDPTPDPISIDLVDKTTSFSMDPVDIASINESLPTISSSQGNEPLMVQGLPEQLSYTYDNGVIHHTFNLDISGKNIQINPDGTNTAFDYDFEAPLNSTVTVPAGTYTVERTSARVVIPEQTTSCSFTYSNFPADVERINTIEFGTPGSQNGQPVTLTINLADVDEIMHYPSYVIEDLTVTFPQEFVLAKDAQCEYPYTVNGNVLKVSNASLRDSTLMVDPANPTNAQVTFYMKELRLNRGVDQPSGSVMTYTGDIKYKATIRIGGIPHLIGSAQINAGASVNAKLSMKDISVNTRLKSVSIPSGSIQSNFNITGLDDVSRVNSIQFDSNGTAISMSISDLDIAPFALDDESAISVTFDEKYKFDTSVCKDARGNTVGHWTENAGRQTLTLDKSAIGTTFNLVLDRLEINSNVALGHLNLTNDIAYSGQLLISPKQNLKLSDLEALGTKECRISVWGNLNVKNADVVTSVITSELKDSTTINIDEKVDNALAELSKVELATPAQISFKLKFKGIPTSINQVDLDRFRIEFPEFIKLMYAGKDSRISLDGNVLKIDGALSRQELATGGQGFVVNGLFIEGLEFLENPVRKADDDTYITLKGSKVKFEGAVSVSNQSISSDELSDITVSPEVAIDPMVIKSVTGRVNPEIDPVNETVALDLGQDLDFLKDRGNTLRLGNPELAIHLSTTLPLAVNLDVEMSSILNGEYLVSGVKPDGGKVTIPACPAGVEKKDVCILFYCNERPAVESNDTVMVRISRFPDLISRIPDSISIKMNVAVSQDAESTVDLTRDLMVKGAYDVTVPFEFTDLTLCYSDTINGMAEDLAEAVDITENMGRLSCVLKAKLESTIPLGLDISFKALDIDGKEIPEIKLSSAPVKAGYKNNPVTSDIEIAFEAAAGSLARLDGIEFTVTCNSGQNSGSLCDTEYIYIHDALMVLPEGVTVDLSEALNETNDND